MNNTQIREILVAHGFKLSGEDARGNPDLKLYVYEAVKAVLAAQTAPVVPEGWKLVPVEMTTEMRDAFYASPHNDDFDAELREAYRQMLSAAPSAPIAANSENSGWISAEDRLPEPGQHVIVTRYAGAISNKQHPGYPGKPWTEFSVVGERGDIFLCDLLSTGYVTHWMPFPPAPLAATAQQKGGDHE